MHSRNADMASKFSFPASQPLLSGARTYLSPRECQFGLWYAVIFMTSRGYRAGINESCRITLTLVVLRTRTRFLCVTTRKPERTYLKLLFQLTAFHRVSRLSTNAQCQHFSKKLIHRVSLFYCNARLCNLCISTISQPCTNLFQRKKMLFIIT